MHSLPPFCKLAPSYRRKAPNPANAIVPTHASEPNPSNERTVVAAEALVVVAVLGALEVELALPEADEPLGVALARPDRAVSVVSAADNPVTFLQEEGAAMVPATKFTAAH